MFFHHTAAKLKNFSHQPIQKLTVMGYYHYRTVKLFNRFLQYIFRTHIKMVGRLIQNKKVNRFKQQFNHSQSTTLSSRKYFYFLVRCFASKHKGSQYISDF